MIGIVPEAGSGSREGFRVQASKVKFSSQPLHSSG